MSLRAALKMPKYGLFYFKLDRTISVVQLSKIVKVICGNNFIQRAKKVVSDSPGLVDFAIGLVNSVFNFPDGQVMFFEEFEELKNYEINSASQKVFGAS